MHVRPEQCAKVFDDDPVAGADSRHVAMVRLVFYCCHCVRIRGLGRCAL